MAFETFNDIVDSDGYNSIGSKSAQEIGEREDHVVQVVF